MMERIIILTIVLIGFLSTSSCEVDYLTEKPDYFDTCVIADGYFTKCLPRTFQKLIQEVIKGIPNLKDFPQLEPYELDKTLINVVCNNGVTMKVELSKIQVYGIESAIIKGATFDPKDYTFQTKTGYPLMKIEGDYIIDGKVKSTSLKGKGRMSLTFDNMDVLLYTKANLYEKGGFTFMNKTSAKLDYAITGLKSDITNLFNGKELEDSSNGFFSKNWEVLADSFKPIIQEALSDTFLDVLNRVYGFIPVNFIISDFPKST